MRSQSIASSPQAAASPAEALWPTSSKTPAPERRPAQETAAQVKKPEAAVRSSAWFKKAKAKESPVTKEEPPPQYVATDSAGSDFSRALAYLQAGNLEEARQAFDKLKKKASQRGNIYSNVVASLKIALDAQTERVRAERKPSRTIQAVYSRASELLEHEVTGLSLDQRG